MGTKGSAAFKQKLRVMPTVVKVKKLKSFEVEIHGMVYNVRAVSSAEAFNLAVTDFRAENELASNVCVLATRITEIHHEIGAKA